jgi:N-acetylneuraminic acid mutarotase
MMKLIIDQTFIRGGLQVFLFICCLSFFSPDPVSAQERAWSIVNAKGSYTPRVGNGFMACKGQFYLFGGIGSRSMDVFDPETDTWSRGTELPVNMHHFQAVRLGDEIYVLGTFTGDPPGEKVLEDIYIFNTSSMQWRKGDPIPKDRLRASCGVVAFRDMIYMIGGRSNSGESCSWADRYDPVTGKWKKLRDAPRNREYYHAPI